MRDINSLYLSVGVLIVILYSNTDVGCDLEVSMRLVLSGAFIKGQQRSVSVTGILYTILEISNHF